MSAWPVTGETSFLICAAFCADGGVKGQRTVENATRNLSAVCHLAKRCGIERGLDLGVDRLNSRKQRHLRLGDAERMCQVDGILHDVDLVFELGSDVDCRVGDEQSASIGGRIHDEDVRDAARSAQPGIVLHGGLYQFVGVQTALHHGLRPPGRQICNADFGRLGFCVGVDDGKAADVAPIFAASAFIAASGPINVGSISPAAAASTAPLIATSVIGHTTAVVIAGRFLQRAMNL